MKLIPSERLFIRGLLSPPSLRCFCLFLFFFPPHYWQILWFRWPHHHHHHIHFAKWLGDLLKSKHFPSVLVSHKEEIKDRNEETPPLQVTDEATLKVLLLEQKLRYSPALFIHSQAPSRVLSIQWVRPKCLLSFLWRSTAIPWNWARLCPTGFSVIKPQWHHYSFTHCFIFCNIN